MKSPVYILHLEDNRNDCTVVQSILKEAGIVCETVFAETQSGFVAALEKGGIDLVLSDFTLPAFDGLSAIAIVKAGWPDLPVILVSGTLGEELAIDCLKSGATDYVLKERLGRLVPAVKRAMQEVEERAERKLLEAQFIEAQKMEVIGQLAGGVAHDFNNLLAIIMGYSDLLASSLESASPLQKYTGEIRHASERAAGLTRQLLVFSRKEIVVPVILELNDAVAELSEMLRRLVDENIELSILRGKEKGTVKADSGYIGQVLMNLVVNARDAMSHGGKLIIGVDNIRLKAGDLQLENKDIAGDYVVLTVRDTGTGMSPDVLKHLFEAFYTTKPAGKGTGLGLSTCQTIVQQSGGFIKVGSVLGEGSTFKIYFPRVEEEEVIAPKTIVSFLPCGTETLLVVEDEPSVRHLARHVLEAQGYYVLSASNGQEALHVARAHKGTPISLVITDVIMPLMGGKVMAEWLETSYPGLKILFTSGYTDETISHHGVFEAGVEFLPKPYSPAILLRKVRELLDQQPKPAAKGAYAGTLVA